jgi:formylglycine-generating enzyme required for sulfatase activity
MDPNLPVAWVDWCDAYAYCKAVGKRLCGEPLKEGNAQGYARHSQQYAACTSNGAYEYTYGNAYDAAACNTADAGNGKPVAVGSMKRCQSSAPGYTGVYDLSGNVWEWEDHCHDRGQQGGKETFCMVKGGSFSLAGGEFSRCARLYSVSRNNPSLDIGFRCCTR